MASANKKVSDHSLEVRNKILNILTYDVYKSPTEIGLALGSPISQASSYACRHLKPLVEEGLVLRATNGRYAKAKLTPSVLEGLPELPHRYADLTVSVIQQYIKKGLHPVYRIADAKESSTVKPKSLKIVYIDESARFMSIERTFRYGNTTLDSFSASNFNIGVQRTGSEAFILEGVCAPTTGEFIRFNIATQLEIERLEQIADQARKSIKAHEAEINSLNLSIKSKTARIGELTREAFMADQQAEVLRNKAAGLYVQQNGGTAVSGSMLVQAGWTSNGGSLPLNLIPQPGSTYVDLKLRSGDIARKVLPKNWDWTMTGKADDVVAWRFAA